MKTKKNNKEFLLEAEMIPIIIKGISEKFKIKHYVEEFKTGNGIPDIVFTKNIQNENYDKMDYESYYFIIESLKKGKIKIDLKNLDNKYKYLIEYLVKNEYLEQMSEDLFYRKKELEPLTGDIIAVEAKLSDWKNGFYQALRYKYFANESYLAISKSKIKNVDKNLLKSRGIGLIAVDTDEVNVILKSKKASPLNKTSFFYSSQKICEAIRA